MRESPLVGAVGIVISNVFSPIIIIVVVDTFAAVPSTVARILIFPFRAFAVPVKTLNMSSSAP